MPGDIWIMLFLVMKNFDFKAIVLIVLLSCVFLTFSCAREKVIRGEGNPDIDKYLKCEVKNLTEHDNLYYYPKFLIKPQRQGAYQILEYEIHYQYYFRTRLEYYIRYKKAIYKRR